MLNNSINKHKFNFMNLFLAILLLTSVDTVMFGTNGNTVFLYVPRFMGLILVLLVLYIKNVNLVIEYRKFFILVSLLLIVVISSLLNNTEIFTAISRVLAILTGYIIVSYYNKDRFIHVFDNLMYVLTVTALVVFILAYIFPTLIFQLPQVTNTKDVVFAYFGIGGAMISFIQSGQIFRNSSIFWEPGAYAVYLVFAIYFQLFQVKNKSNKKILVFIIGLLTTFSTTGYIAVSALFITLLVSSKKSDLSNIIKFSFVMFLLSIIFVVIIGSDTLIYKILFEKIASGYSTSITRYASIINGLQIAIDNPIYGVSPNNMAKYMEIYARKTTMFNFGGNSMNSNTVTYQFASYGIFFGAVFTYGTFSFFKVQSDKIFVTLFLFITFLLAYSGEQFYSFLPFVVMFYGYSTNMKIGHSIILTS